MAVAVVGSGPTGIAAALELATAGIEVDLLDGGEVHETPLAVEALARTVRAGGQPSDEQMRWLRYGAGARRLAPLLKRSFSLLRGVVDPENLEKRILGSTYTFRGADRSVPLVDGWLPRSAAVGGLANAWGAACYTLRADDYRDWPVPPEELRPGFERAAELLGLTGEDDSLSDAYPVLGPMIPPIGHLSRDPGSLFESLIGQWRARAGELAGLGIRAGRSRLAVRLRGQGEHDCVRCGLCAFGCPTGAIWNPSRVLYGSADGIRHLPGRLVDVFEGHAPRIFLRGERADGSSFSAGPYEAVFLAAGALGSFRIAARSLGFVDASAPLLDNDMFIVPFRIDSNGEVGAPVRFGLSEAVLALDPGTVAERAVHIQLYRVTEPLLGPVGPLLGMVPSVASSWIRRAMSRYVLGFAYLHSSDSRRLKVQLGGSDFALSVGVEPATEPGSLPRLLDLLKRAAALTGLHPVKGLARAMPPGFSAHLGGTVPLTGLASIGELATQLDGGLCGADRIYVIDLSALPAVPAQNATLAGMANAVRTVRGYLGNIAEWGPERAICPVPRHRELDNPSYP